LRRAAFVPDERDFERQRASTFEITLTPTLSRNTAECREGNSLSLVCTAAPSHPVFGAFPASREQRPPAQWRAAVLRRRIRGLGAAEGGCATPERDNRQFSCYPVRTKLESEKLMLEAMKLAAMAAWRGGLRRNRRHAGSHGFPGRRRWSRSPGFSTDVLEPRVLLSGEQIFVTNAGLGTVGEYTTSGATVNASLISGLSTPEGIAAVGSDLFVVNQGTNSIGEYTTSGATVNASLITGLVKPIGIAASGSDLFVTNETGDTIGEYTTSGATVNASLVTGLSHPRGIAVFGSDLFVANLSTGTIGEFTTSGATVNASLVSGINQAGDVVVSGSDLFVSEDGPNTIGEFTTSGASVNTSLISGLNNPAAIAVSGSDVFVVNNDGDTIGQYTTSGATVNASLISGLTGPVGIVIATTGPVTPTTTVLSSTNPAGVGGTVTLIAKVVNPFATPTGTVTFLDGSTPIGTAALDATGTATLSTSALTLGTHSITFSYPGDTNDLASTSAPLSQSIIQPKSIGILDPVFSSGGVASHDVGFTATSGLAVQPDGKSVIAGIIGSPGSEEFGLTRYNADGSLDTSFGTNGVASVSFQGTNDTPSSVALLPDGDILVAGTSTVTSGGSEFAIALFNADGTLDTSFGSGTGKVLTSFATGSTDIANAVVLGLGGEFFVVGSSTAGGTGTDFAMAAYDADGTPATGFNSSGRELGDFSGGNDSANAAVVQSNGELVVAGSTANPSTGVTSIALARLLPNGAPDIHFGTKGLIVTNLRGADDEATSVALAAKGAIVVGGESATGSLAAGTLATDFAVLRYTSAGKLDRTFNRTGSIITSFGEDAAVTRVLVQSDGTIIASGKTASSFGSTSLGIAVARYTAKGTLDTSFNGGKTLITLTGQGATASLERPSAIVPLDGQETLQQQFAAFVSSAQGIVATTPGGDLAVAGNSDGFTEEGQLVAAGIDLAASLLAKLPASLKAGASVSITIGVTEAGSTSAGGVVTVELFLSGSSSVAPGDTQVFNKPEALKLKPSQAKSFRFAIKLPKTLTAGNYDLVAVVNTNSLTDLNPLNNVAFKGPVAIP
jgi:uncharacterized delta-60 repeat protein